MVVLLEMCVLWLEVANYVWTDVCSEWLWLQVVSGGGGVLGGDIG